MALDPINTHSNLPLGKLQEEVHEWIANHGVRYFNELTNMAQLTEEVGEVARIIARRYGEQSEKESDKAKDLGEELSDVLFVVLCLANQTGTDLQTAFDKKMNVKRNATTTDIKTMKS
jgi:NTP pyrophosphatase (non-canonical NTP hydrolase)